MSTSAEKRKQLSALQREIFKIKPVAIGCGLLAFASAGFAQTAPVTPNTLETVTVTGIRRGIEAAISIKKNSDNIVEAVSAEDIGKLPDNSIAESISRLPGLSSQRSAGSAQVISVRGLSPDFATTLLNGRELVSTGDNRSVEFDQYPSELLSGVTVYKTPSAAMVGQGLSGTMDMQTVRPLNFGKSVVALNARASQNSLGSAANASDRGNRFSASYIDQFANRTIGLAIGFAHQETPVQENQTGTYEPFFANPSDGGKRPGVVAGAYLTDGVKALRRTGETKRDGLMATLEWKPSADFSSTVDLFASRATKEDTSNQFESHLYYNGDYPCQPACNWNSSTVNASNTVVGGVVTNVYPLVRGQYNKREDDIKAIGWNNAFKLGGASMVADLGYSKATRDELYLENNTQLMPYKQLDVLTVAFPNDGFMTMNPARNYSDPSKLFLRNSIYGSGYGRTPSVEDELKSFKLAGKIPAPESMSGYLADFDIGFNYADRSKKKRQPEGNINLGAQGETTIASELQYAPVDLGFAGSNLASIPAWNVPGSVAKYMTFNPSETSAAYLIAKAWNVYEKTSTGYAMANLDSTLSGGVSLRGNIGVQVQHIDQSSSANYWDGTAPAGQEVKPFSDGKTMTEVLPSMNLVFGLGNDQNVRFGAAVQTARPRVDQLRAALDFDIDKASGKPSANGGNPRLDPWKANAFDLSYEKYYATKAYVAVAGYYKDLKTYIYEDSREVDFSPFVAGFVPGPGSPPAQTKGQYRSAFNGNGGKLQGVEVSASLPFNLLSPVMNGFGLTASYSYTTSNIKIKPDPGSVSAVGEADITLPGLSKNVANLTFYYENSGFEARISQRMRSDFIGEIGNFNGNRTVRYVVGESITDAQIGYNFNQGSLKGLGLLLQVTNLGDAANQTYAGTKDRPLEYIKWGRTVLLGANYKF
ncbi:TonB-dependent receptor [Roseateles sp.]|uniref:TonB-dependent receptor n=1 Tax=Roseateles sp. TaxID=1971397 RepID=UPI00286B0418|nr:TonB-dependent receptor [Roseateles sp.]